MAGTTDKPNEWMAQWLKMQESLMKEWASSLGKMMKSSAPPEEWMKMPFSPGGLYEQWSRSLSDLDKKQEEEGVGRLVYNRIASSSKVYMDLLNFWSKATGTLKSVPVGRTFTMEEISELRNNWMKNYRELMETLWGKRPASDEESLAKTLEGTALSASDLTWSLVEPILKNVAQMPDIVQKISRGDTSAVRFNTAKNAFSAMLYKTGLKAAEKVYQRSSEFIGKEASPETFKAFYRLWWTINEETYHDLLSSDEFTTMAKEMITRGLLFRKGFDELTDHVLKFTNIPGKKDMDEIYKTIYELKREVRNQKRAIRDLEKQAAAKNRKKKPA
ncbi:MAG: hypothetical protein NTV99_11825 [Deltaproteobacteria bacterium]|nr:hypothetical protein [Deltaproteobacteria bacterium]